MWLLALPYHCFANLSRQRLTAVIHTDNVDRTFFTACVNVTFSGSLRSDMPVNAER